MNKSLEQLIQISKYDILISSFKPKINTENEKLEELTNVSDKLKSSIAYANEVIEESKKKKNKNNTHLLELRDKLDDIKEKTNIISTQKEAKALQLEEEIANEQISFTNNEIERLENIIEQKNNELEDLNKQLVTEEIILNESSKVITERIDNLEKERLDVAANRDGLITKVDTKVLSFYQKIKRWANDTAVTKVKKQSCYGCYMKLNDKVYRDVLRSEDIITCPHCGRILFNDKNVEE